MAVTDSTNDFEPVSRLRGVVFEKLSLGASVFGIVALAVLLIYVVIDAFDLTAASPEWLLTFFITLVLPFVAFSLYSANDRTLTRQVVVALGGGLVATAVLFYAFELLIRPIPRLSWQLTYLFVVAIPTTGYVAVAGTREQMGQVGFGVLGRLLGGAGLGGAFVILFDVFDARLWFLTYTIALLPALGLYAWGRISGSRLSALTLPVAIAGTAAAVFVNQSVSVYPSALPIYIWTVVIPVAAATGLLYSRRRGRRAGLATGGFVLVSVVVGSLLAGVMGIPQGNAALVLVTTIVPTTVYAGTVIDTTAGRIGLLFPVVLVVGTLAGATLVSTFGFPAPDPWIDPSYVTNSPSRTPSQAGLYPAIVGSVMIIALVAVLSFVLGIGSAVFLEEYTAGSGIVGGITRVIQINIANLAAVPSVVYGLLGLGLFANALGFGFGTVVTAAATLSLLILPITIISAQEAIRSVPDDLRQGSYAMGATRWQTTKNVVLPESFSGILTGTILALGRAIGETAPLIMIGAPTTVFNAPDGLWSRASAMPMQIFAWSDFPQEDFRYGVVAAGVVTLLVVLLGMNATAIIMRNRSERDL